MEHRLLKNIGFVVALHLLCLVALGLGGVLLLLTNIPQKYMEHSMMTAYASVDGNSVNMLEDNGSANAAALLKVVNNPGFDLPDTGDNGTMLLSIIGIVTMAGAALVIVLATRKKSNPDRK